MEETQTSPTKNLRYGIYLVKIYRLDLDKNLVDQVSSKFVEDYELRT